MSRARVEDLGRIMVMIENLLDLDVWDTLHDRPNRSQQWFKNLSEEEKDEVIRKISYSMDSVKDHLYKILEIAQGQDYLNQPEEESVSKGEYF